MQYADCFQDVTLVGVLDDLDLPQHVVRSAVSWRAVRPLLVAINFSKLRSDRQRENEGSGALVPGAAHPAWYQAGMTLPLIGCAPP
jgi:hypothetical protein